MEQPIYILAAAWLLTYLIHSTVLISGAWIATKLNLVRTYAAKDLLWKTALLGGIATATLQLSLGVGPTFDHLAQPSATETVITALDPSAVQAIETQEASQDILEEYTEVIPEVILPEQLPTLAQVSSVPSTEMGISWSIGLEALVFAWLFGMVLLAAWHLWSWQRFVSQIGTRRILYDEEINAMVRDIATQAGISQDDLDRLRLTVAPGLVSPVAFGNNEICLPERALSELDPNQLRSVLAHEWAHLFRRDPMWIKIQTVVQTVFFFQPLNRLVRRQLEANAEHLCDGWAVQHTGQNHALAESLIEVASWMIHEGRRPVMVAGVASKGSLLSERVQRLLSDVRDEIAGIPQTWRYAIMGVALALVIWAIPGIGIAEEKASAEETALYAEELQRVEEDAAWLDARRQQTLDAVAALRKRQEDVVAGQRAQADILAEAIRQSERAREAVRNRNVEAELAEARARLEQARNQLASVEHQRRLLELHRRQLEQHRRQLERQQRQLNGGVVWTPSDDNAIQAYERALEQLQALRNQGNSQQSHDWSQQWKEKYGDKWAEKWAEEWQQKWSEKWNYNNSNRRNRTTGIGSSTSWDDDDIQAETAELAEMIARVAEDAAVERSTRDRSSSRTTRALQARLVDAERELNDAVNRRNGLILSQQQNGGEAHVVALADINAQIAEAKERFEDAVVESHQIPSQNTFSRRGERMYNWAIGDRKMRVRVNGEVYFGEDDVSIRGLKPGSYLILEETTAEGTNIVEITSDSHSLGTPTFSFVFGAHGGETNISGGEAWPSNRFREIARKTALDAQNRVHRLYEKGGITGVLEEVSQLHSDWAKQVYLETLVTHNNLATDELVETLEAIRPLINSRSYRTTLLEGLASLAEHSDRAVREAYTKAKQAR